MARALLAEDLWSMIEPLLPSELESQASSSPRRTNASCIHAQSIGVNRYAPRGTNFRDGQWLRAFNVDGDNNRIPSEVLQRAQVPVV